MAEAFPPTTEPRLSREEAKPEAPPSDSLAQAAEAPPRPHAPFPYTCFYCCAGLPSSPEVGGYMALRVLQAFFVVHSAVLFGPALQAVFREDAGCPKASEETCEDDNECDGRVLGGLRVSSAISTIVTASSLLSALLMPALGALCDVTSMRRGIGIAGCLGQALTVLAGVALDTSTLWFIVVVVFLGYVAKNVIQLMVASYLPELSSVPSEQAKASGMGNAWLYGSEVAGIAVLVVVSGLLDLSDKGRGRLSSGVNGVLILAMMPLVFGALKPKPPTATLADGESIVRYSYARVYKLVVSLRQTHTDYANLLLAVLVYDPACGSLVLLASVFMQETLCLSASEVSNALAVAILCAVPGAVLASWYANTLVRAHLTLTVGLVCTAVVTGLAAVALPTGEPGPTVLFAGAWGVLLGASWQCAGFQLALLVPPGQEAELGGMLVTCYNTFQWLPPLLFTIVNEASGSMRGALVTLCPMILVGTAILFFGVNLERGSRVVAADLHRRRTVVA